MATSCSINSGCQPLLNPDTCVSVEDDNRDGRADDITARFTGEDGHQYELRAQANSSKKEWGEEWVQGSEVTLTDRGPALACDLTPNPPQLLAHYRVTGNYALSPLDVGKNECLPSPAAVQPNSATASMIPMPNGQQAFVAMGDGARVLDTHFQQTQVTWVKLGVVSSSGRATLQVTSEGVGDQNVFAIELGAGHSRRETRFTPDPSAGHFFDAVSGRLVPLKR